MSKLHVPKGPKALTAPTVEWLIGFYTSEVCALARVRIDKKQNTLDLCVVGSHLESPESLKPFGLRQRVPMSCLVDVPDGPSLPSLTLNQTSLLKVRSPLALFDLSSSALKIQMQSKGFSFSLEGTLSALQGAEIPWNPLRGTCVIDGCTHELNTLLCFLSSPDTSLPKSQVRFEGFWDSAELAHALSFCLSDLDSPGELVSGLFMQQAPYRWTLQNLQKHSASGTKILSSYQGRVFAPHELKSQGVMHEICVKKKHDCLTLRAQLDSRNLLGFVDESPNGNPIYQTIAFSPACSFNWLNSGRCLLSLQNPTASLYLRSSAKRFPEVRYIA